MGENRFAAGVKAAKERTSEIQEQQTEKKVENKSEPVQETVKEQQTENPSNEKSLTLTKDGKLDIKSLLSDKKKPKSKAHSLYLDDDIYEKLEKVAKSNKVSVSKALNELLRTIL